MHEQPPHTVYAEAIPLLKPASGVDVSVSVLSPLWDELADIEAAIAMAAAAAIRGAAIDAEVELCVALGADADIRALNLRFRHQDKPTNVLAFPNGMMLMDGSKAVFLGDVMIAYETLMTEAASEAKPPLHHAIHLTVHGVLHLLGYDHDDDASAGHMETLERQILFDLGIADPYSAGLYAVEPEAA